MESQILDWLLQQGPVVVLAILFLWFQRKDYKETIREKDQIIGDQRGEIAGIIKEDRELIVQIKETLAIFNERTRK